MDELQEHFIDANERMGEALVEIGLALGMPTPSSTVQWGAPEILAELRKQRAELEDLRMEQAQQPAAVAAKLRDLAGDPIGNLESPYNFDTIELVREVLLNRAHDLEDGRA